MNLRRTHGDGAGVVRSARAYLAGFGTTGSLLAGAALMFIVASALVAFRGWPHVGMQPTPAQVVVSPQRSASAAGATLATRRLAFAAAAPAAGAGGAAGALAPSAAGRGLGPTRPATSPTRAIGAPASTSVPVGTAAGAPTTGSPPAATTTTPPPPAPRLLQQVTHTLAPATNALGAIVTNTGAQVGTTVQQTTNTVAGAVGGSSTPVGGAVQGVGSGAAQTVTSVTNGVGGLVSGLGH